MNAPLQLVITMTGAGVTVQGPVQNKGVCYGMLELARDAIKDFKPSDASGLLVPPHLAGG